MSDTHRAPERRSEELSRHGPDSPAKCSSEQPEAGEEPEPETNAEADALERGVLELSHQKPIPMRATHTRATPANIIAT